MIIDFHTHIFPDKIASRSIESLSQVSGITASTNGTLQGLLHSMEKAHVDLSVIMPVVTKPSQFQSVNIFAQQVNEEYKGKLLSFGGIHPDSENYKEELKMIRSMGLPGIKIHPDYQKVMIDDLRYMHIIDYASELGLIVLTHAGVDIGLPDPVHCTPKGIRRVLHEVRPEKFVAAHMGGWKLWNEVCEYLLGQNVYLDTSFSLAYMGQELFLKIWKEHPKDKLLFASDSPWERAEEDIQLIRNMPISESEKAGIFAENARRLLGI